MLPSRFSRNTSAWHLVYTKPRQEEIALLNLERQGYSCYLPRLHIEKVRHGKAQLIREAMFPRYLFVWLDTSDNGQSWAPIQSTVGVSTLVRFGAWPARVDDALIKWLRNREQAAPALPLFSSGDVVVITQGPFAGLEAIYHTTDAKRRILVLLEILSKPVSLRIDAAAVRKG